MPRPTKMTPARLSHSWIRWLRDLVEQEGDGDLIRTCDVAMAGSSMGFTERDIRAAQRRCADAINARTGYDQISKARQGRALSNQQIAADLRAFLKSR